MVLSFRDRMGSIIIISKYRINFPADGMYVMMEWINSGNQYYYDIIKGILM